MESVERAFLSPRLLLLLLLLLHLCFFVSLFLSFLRSRCLVDQRERLVEREREREGGGGIKGALLRMRSVEAPGDKRDCINRSRRIVLREICQRRENADLSLISRDFRGWFVGKELFFARKDINPENSAIAVRKYPRIFLDYYD